MMPPSCAVLAHGRGIWERAQSGIVRLASSLKPKENATPASLPELATDRQVTKVNVGAFKGLARSRRFERHQRRIGPNQGKAANGGMAVVIALASKPSANARRRLGCLSQIVPYIIFPTIS